MAPLAPLATQMVGALHGHLRKNAYYVNLKWSFEDLLPCYCYATKTHSRTIRQLVSQPSSAVKRAEMCELQSHHCIFEQIKWINHIRTRHVARNFDGGANNNEVSTFEYSMPRVFKASSTNVHFSGALFWIIMFRFMPANRSQSSLNWQVFQVCF